MADIAKIIEEVKSMTVLELNELVKAIETEFGRHSQERRRKQDRRYQGRQRGYRSRSRRCEEDGRGSSQQDQRGHQQGYRRRDRQEVQGSRRRRRAQVISTRAITKRRVKTRLFCFLRNLVANCVVLGIYVVFKAFFAKTSRSRVPVVGSA